MSHDPQNPLSALGAGPSDRLPVSGRERLQQAARLSPDQLVQLAERSPDETTRRLLLRRARRLGRESASC